MVDEIDALWERPQPQLRPTSADARARRAGVERLVALAARLPEPDRALVHAVLRDGRSATEVARLLGVPARTLRARVGRLVRRLASPEFTFVAEQAPRWPPLRRRVAEGTVLHGRSVRAVAAELGVSLHVVRRHREAVRTLLEVSRRGVAA